MKTLAVLAALAAVATAVPALPGYSYGYRPVHYRYPNNFRREKKSPQTLIDPAPLEIAIDTSDVAPELARTIALKKPIIIKKKLGYHLYRDSDEEQAHADPSERCNKEVKVKLCDAEHMARSSDMRATEDTEILSEPDMETSIKLAKEAVENLQKMTKFQRTHLGAEDEVHEDIEVARQALEHIQKNFGNLESMNVHAATLSDAEALNNARLTITNTESERMAKWKEAINNIQKNAEIARNIEDSFKSINFMGSPVTEDLESKLKEKSSESNQKSQLESLAQIKVSEDKVDEHELDTKVKNAEPLHEMMSAASEFKESKLEETSDNTKVKEIKSSEKAVTEEESLKESVTQDTKNLEMNEQPKASEHVEVDLAPAPSAPIMTSVSLTKEDETRGVHQLTNVAKETEGEKSAWKETDTSKVLAKTSELMTEVGDKQTELSETKHEKSSEIDTKSLMKSSESSSQLDNLHKLDNLKIEGKNAEQLMKSTDNKLNDNKEVSQHGSSIDVKSAKNELVPDSIKAVENKEEDSTITQLKSAEIPQHIAVAEHKEHNAEIHSARMETSDNGVMSSESSTFVTSAEHKEKDALLKSAVMDTSVNEHMKISTIKSEDQMKSAINEGPADTPKSSDVSTSSKTVSETLNMKSADMDVAPSVQIEDQRPPFINLKSAVPTSSKTVSETINMKSADMDVAPSVQVEQQRPPFITFKTSEHQENTAAMKATESGLPVPPFFPLKSAEHQENTMKEAEQEPNLSAFPFKSGEHQEMNAAMKAAEMTKKHQQHEHSGFQPQGKTWHMDQLKQKTSDIDFEKSRQSSMFGSQFSGPHFIGSPGMMSHGMMNHQVQPMGFHRRPMSGFKAAEADSVVQATSQVNVNDAAGKSALEHGNMMQWKQKEAARGAYGAYGASGAGAGLSIGAGSAGGAAGAGGAGALGVFPGAKVGNCAIPLLLSCSPSVVSGSLASPSYSAPHAYRSAGDFSGRFPMKRDTKATNDISIKMKRTPSKVIQKINLEKKS